ncbi:protocadherin Fat 3-like [Ruditapes philippinarum]|uniref:protocadherin Fat 3-like n=1 Tax=Ruditapes philippinarum TaxID=129788 RepID=UPI00295A992D|nr:protocadherin Fat 3-like [Ruditapes philippinarum]
MKNTWISVIILVFFSALENGDAAITGWTEPSITGAADGPGTLTVPEDQALNTIIVTYVATTDAASITYSLVTAVTPFALSEAGELTITAALDFESETSYTLHVKAEDNNAGVGTATIVVTVTDVVDTPPVFSATYTPCILDGSQEDATLTTVQATPADGATIALYSITDGNIGPAFKIDATSGLIQVATGFTLDKSTLATYELAVEATDDATPTNTGTTTVTATVKDVCDNGSSSVTFSAFLLLLSFLVAKV